MKAKLILVILTVAMGILWLVAGVAAEGELLRNGTSGGGSGMIALVAVVLTAVTLWRIFALRLASDPPREAMRPSTPVRTASQDII